MKKNLISILALSISITAFADNANIPFGNGTWVYDSTYNKTGTTGPVKAGLYFNQISQYNNQALKGREINQVFAYGGDLEMYCRGSGESKLTDQCSPNSLLVSLFPPQQVSKKSNSWDYYLKDMGDSGFNSLEQYMHIPMIKNFVIVLDGRVDQNLTGGYDYLDHLNELSQSEAEHFADKVAKTVCSSNSIQGVQFDIEPFSFTGANGTYQGSGQQYFYTEIAKDFAGYYGNKNDPAGVNSSTKSAPDPLHCVNKSNPHGRFFSVFTFSDRITPNIATVFTHHGNGMIIDSLYDLGKKPGGTLNTPKEFASLVQTEVKNMKQISKEYNIAYQFAIPAAASAHEFESKGGVSTGYKMLTYIKEAIAAINVDSLKANDPNFKGVDIWFWGEKMLWNGDEYTPSSPPSTEGDNVVAYLQSNL